MKKLAIAALAASALLSTPLIAAPKEGSNGAVNSCFGQGRSAYASTHSGDQSNGKYISERAKSPATSDEYPNANVEQNELYRMACEAAAQGD
jgi:hypothetical protein